jgi:glycosyltransferase involved in cell wall biosynthesis
MTGVHPGLVGFDASPLEMRQRAGVSQYTAQLLSALVARGDGRRYALLAGRSLAGIIPPGTLGPIGRQLPNRTLWMQIVLPRTLAALRPELCHFTNSIAPLATSCPFVVTVHDMSLFRYPGLQPLKSLLLVRTIVRAVARRARAVIAVSHSARRDILSQMPGLPPENVHVVYEAAAPEYRVIGDGAALERVRRTYGLYDPFILHVGTIEPRKNLERLVEAFHLMRRRGRRERLVLAGQLGWKYDALLRQIDASGDSGAITLLGYVPHDDLPALYNLARVVAFPSLYEGFGLPILESMACGTPVVTANRSSTAELSGDAAVQVDPEDAEALAEGLAGLLGDQALREQLRARGLARAAQFHWARAAEETVNIYELATRSTVGQGTPHRASAS